MRQLPIEQQVLLVVEIAALLALCLRMWLTGLYKIYANFFQYLILQFLETLIPLVVPVQTLLYRDLFVVSRALNMLFYALVVLELYSLVLRNFEGISGIARRYIKFALMVAIFIALLPLLLEKTPNTLTGYLFIFERPILSTLVGCLLLISAFLVYYPVPLGRNAIAYLAGYSLYFLTTAIMVFINNLGYFWNREKSTIDMGVLAACLIFWLLVLSPQGENKRLTVGHQWNPADEERLMARLEALNGSLLRSGKQTADPAK